MIAPAELPTTYCGSNVGNSSLVPRRSTACLKLRRLQRSEQWQGCEHA